MSDFGARLRKARESKGISLEQIANQTRISTRFLEAIENEDFQALPGGVFNRGFIKSYAECVGLDPEDAVADYARLTHVKEPDLSILSTSATPPNRNQIGLVTVAAIALILLIAIVYIVTKNTGTPITADSPATPAVVAPPPAVEPANVQAASAETQPEPALPPLRIEMEVREETWVVMVADGVTVIDGIILQPGSTHRYTANESVNLTVGNAGGLTLTLNDRDVPPLGRPGRVRTLLITPDNIDDIIG